jgi:branched-chain amino acid transport system substrate-binding protein
MGVVRLRKVSISVVLLCCTVFLWVSCTRTPEPEPEPEIRIGVIAYLKGEYADLDGAAMVNASNMALASLGPDGGLMVGSRKHSVKIITVGINNVPEEAVAAATKLINRENVVAIIGPQFSNDAIPAGAIAELAKIPMICPISTNPEVTAGRKYVFRMSFLDDIQGKTMADFAIGYLEARSAAVLFDIADSYSRGIAEVFRARFRESGGKVLAFESYTSGERDFTEQLNRIADRRPEVLYYPTYSEDALRQAQQARKLGIDSVLLGSDGWDQREFTKYTEFDGSFMTAHWSVDLDNDNTRDFVTEYRQTYGQDPNDSVVLTFDALNMVFEAIRSQSKATPQSIRKGLYSLEPYEGVGGTVDFVDTGDPEKGAVILQFSEGKVRFIRIVKPN